MPAKIMSEENIATENKVLFTLNRILTKGLSHSSVITTNKKKLIIFKITFLWWRVKLKSTVKKSFKTAIPL